MGNLQLTISHPDTSHKGKLVLIQKYLERCSGKKTTYTFEVDNQQVIVNPPFISFEGLNRVKDGILEILNDKCEEMDDRGKGCSEHYNCCDCGDNNCGCRYCFSCNACEYCLGD